MLLVAMLAANLSQHAKLLLVCQCHAESTACLLLQSRFFAVCGFGNLPGDVVFYDKKVDGKCKIMGSTR